MVQKIKLVVGDWSKDGHERTEHIFIEVSVTKEELKEAYKKGTQDVLGYDFAETYCSEYEDNVVPAKTAKTLHDAGFNEWDYEDYEEGSSCLVDAQTFANIWLFLARKGNPDIFYAVTKEDEHIDIGGYGLFE